MRFLILLGLVSSAAAVASPPILAPYGVQHTVPLMFLDADGFGLEGEVDGDGDGASEEAWLICDGGSPALATNSYGEAGGGGYRLALEATELQCKSLVIWVDASVSQTFTVETYGHASAQHPNLGWLTGDAYTAASALPSASAIRTEIDNNSTQLAAILADTDELQQDWTNGGRLDNILDARASQTSVDALPAAGDIADAIGARQAEDEDGGYSYDCIMAALLAFAAGEMDVSGATTTYTDPGGNEVRISGSRTGNARHTITITCP